MLDKRQIESILRINGMNSNSTVEEITAVLASARYSADEVNQALSVLKGGVDANTLTEDGLHKVFRSSAALKPSEISRFLSIDVGIDELRGDGRNRATDLNEPIVFAFATVAISATGLVFAMYAYDIDILHIAEKAFGGV